MDLRPPSPPAEFEENQEPPRARAPAPIDAATAARIRTALANPRPLSPAAEAFARVDARKAAYKAKYGL